MARGDSLLAPGPRLRRERGLALPAVAALVVVINFAGLAAIVVINIAATAGVHAARPGLAAGILRTCQQAGAAFGVALPSVVATARGWAPIPAALLAHRAV